ncbi:thioesterase family protein [Aspergillus costaricaensis CBS 115574]|uniref:Thioesterase family protein n=1 Tax=Aspergillus costaricaensis CBS 115574 TaxID=1448317 RepID=A0ACD1IK96_9EURO|nr:thioesterase family protein [Aspergillus costaricaensis CBS 115574]RAK90172.1 thioesterase family protein [Aspergillus costaricaensis CBS 115574]
MSLPRTTTTITRLLTKRPPTHLIIPHTQIRTIKAGAASSAIESPSTLPSYHDRLDQPPTPTPTPQSTLSAAEHLITTHPLVQSLRSNPSYKESRPHLHMKSSHRPNHFVAGTLSGANKVTVPPYMFTSIVNRKPSSSQEGTTTTKEGKESPRARLISVFHIGPQLCGHPGYVHGGLLSVMFDEAFARCVSDSFKSGLGMTANLNVDFRKPALPERVYVLKAETVKVEGRKAWVEGEMRSMPAPGSEEGEEGETVVAEARALFVEPKFAESMVPLYRN